MKFASVALVFSALSFVGVGVLFVKMDDMEQKLELRQSNTEARRSVDARQDVSADEPASYRGSDFAAPAADAPTGTLEERVDRLEEERDRYRDELAQVRKKAEGARKPYMFNHRSFATSVNHLSTTLKLTPTQKTRVQDAVDRGKRLIEEVMKIPDESGKSPAERRDERRKKIQEAIANKDTSGIVPIAMRSMNYRSQKIPGRNETYGQEIDRIKNETRDEITSTLSSEQAETFKDTNIDPMLGGAGGASMVFTSFAEHAGDGEGGPTETRTVVGGSIEIEDVVTEAPSGGTPSGPTEEEEDDG